MERGLLKVIIVNPRNHRETGSRDFILLGQLELLNPILREIAIRPRKLCSGNVGSHKMAKRGANRRELS